MTQSQRFLLQRIGDPLVSTDLVPCDQVIKPLGIDSESCQHCPVRLHETCAILIGLNIKVVSVAGCTVSRSSVRRSSAADSFKIVFAHVGLDWMFSQIAVDKAVHGFLVDRFTELPLLMHVHTALVQRR